jgi:hypothetical protein
MSPTKGRPRFEPGARREAQSFPPPGEESGIYIKEEIQITITDSREGLPHDITPSSRPWEA